MVPKFTLYIKLNVQQHSAVIMPFLEPPELTIQTIPPSGTDVTLNAPPVSSSNFPPDSLRSRFSGLEFTVYQLVTDHEVGTNKEILKMRFSDPVGSEQTGPAWFETNRRSSFDETLEILSIVIDRLEGKEKEHIASARLGILHQYIQEECAKATKEDHERAYLAGTLKDRVRFHVWNAVTTHIDEFEIHSDDVNRLVYALCQTLSGDLEDLDHLDMKVLLLSARKDAAPAPATVEAAAPPVV